MAGLAPLEQVAFDDSGILSGCTADGVHAMAIGADRQRSGGTLSVSDFLAMQLQGHAMKIRQVGLYHCGGKAIFRHDFLFPVTSAAGIGDGIVKRGGTGRSDAVR